MQGHSGGTKLQGFGGCSETATKGNHDNDDDDNDGNDDDNDDDDNDDNDDNDDHENNDDDNEVEPIEDMRRNGVDEIDKEISALLKGIEIATPTEIKDIELRLARWDADMEVCWCTACHSHHSFDPPHPKFDAKGFFVTGHSTGKKHKDKIETQFLLDALVGKPGNALPDKQAQGLNSIRNADKMVEHGKAFIGFTGKVTKQNMKNYWGEVLENLPRALENIHHYRGVIKVKIWTENKKSTDIEEIFRIAPAMVKSYVLSLVTYNPSQSKYKEQVMVSWADVPEEEVTEMGCDHAILNPQESAGVWPAVQLVLHDTLNDAILGPLKADTRLLVCIYQCLWDPPVAWIVNDITEMPDISVPLALCDEFQGIWASPGSSDEECMEQCAVSEPTSLLQVQAGLERLLLVTPEDT
jgi:hypothetical protein